MDILFTTTTSPLSKAIRKVTGEPMSHCAIKVNDYVLHSDLLGTRIETYKHFSERNTVVKKLSIGKTSYSFIKLAEKYEGRKYDYLGLLYLGLRYILRPIRKFLPKANLWQTSGMFLCTELITQVIDNKEDSLITPYKLFLKLTKKKKED